jgi:hypothetical protein
MACDVPGLEGNCVEVDQLETDDRCSGLEACDGDGACKNAPGQPCTLDNDCASDSCTTLVCD